MHTCMYMHLACTSTCTCTGTCMWKFSTFIFTTSMGNVHNMTRHIIDLHTHMYVLHVHVHQACNMHVHALVTKYTASCAQTMKIKLVTVVSGQCNVYYTKNTDFSITSFAADITSSLRITSRLRTRGGIVMGDVLHYVIYGRHYIIVKDCGWWQGQAMW